MPLTLSGRVPLALVVREDDEDSSTVLLPEREVAGNDTPEGRFTGGLRRLDDVLGGGGIGGPPGCSGCWRCSLRVCWYEGDAEVFGAIGDARVVADMSWIRGVLELDG